MNTTQLEAWALSIVDRIRAGLPVEDFRVEVKANWIDSPSKAARRIAGHANAARGEPILWVVGIDEKTGRVAINVEERADWVAQVFAEFDGLPPSLRDLVVPVDGGAVVALLFDTTRAPFVVRNPARNVAGGGPVELEVPWREGTSIRSARREDLIRIIAPLNRLPTVDILFAKVAAGTTSVPDSTGTHLGWNASLGLYAVPMSDSRVVIPKHRIRAELLAPEVLPNGVPLRIHLNATALDVRESPTVTVTKHEVILAGPGGFVIDLRAVTEGCFGEEIGEVGFRVSLLPSSAEYPLEFEVWLPHTHTTEYDPAGGSGPNHIWEVALDAS